MEFEENKKSGSVLTALLLRVIVLLLCLAGLIILFPTKKSLDPLYQNLFRENINSMKDAAEAYYTNERLPKELNKSEKMTLREMLEKNLVLPFVDKNNKECNLDQSYVEITKVDNEYELKVNLICPTNEAYIIEHLGCANKCESDACTKDLENETAIEYQFMKSTTKKVISEYTCDTKNGYVLKDNMCYKAVQVEKTIEATPKYKIETITREANKDIRTTTTCDAGWTLTNGNCVKDATVETVTKKYCNGKETENNTCTKSTNKTTVKAGETYSEWVYVEEKKSLDPLSTYSNNTEKMISNGSGYERECDDDCAMEYYYYYIVYRRTATPTYKTTYSCDAGWTKLNNSTCSKTAETKTTTKKYCDGEETTSDICSKVPTTKTITTYSCDPDWTRQENDEKICFKNSKTIVDYICPNEYKLSNTNKCIGLDTKVITKKANASYKNVTNTIYTWSRNTELSGWIRTGNTRQVTK